jgi:diguanylate cyclase (GGDEF)-like protein
MQQFAYLKDPLTGVYSRAMLNVRLAEELERALRYSQPFTLLLVDIDHFKSVNDAFGHSQGDKVLAEFARRVEASVRGSDSVFRYGGDEFVVLLPSTDKTQALITADRLLEQIRDFPFNTEPPLNITISIGLASFPDDSPTAEGLFEVSDQRHQVAKRQGRNQVVSAPPEPTSQPLIESPSRLIERDMDQAIVNQFLEALPEHNRSVLRITGPAGSGKSRMLSEIRKIARLRGYAVLMISGRPAIKNRLHAALIEAQDQLHDFHLNLEDENPGSSFSAYLSEKGQAGVIIAIDELPYIDRGTLQYIRDLFYASELAQLGLVYTEGGSGNLRNFPYSIPLQEVITLRPISPAGLRIWLRQSLQWEAPHDFIAWLRQETQGLPRHIHRALLYMIEQNLLQRQEEGWNTSTNLSEIQLTSFFLQETTSPRNNLPGIPGELVDRLEEVYELKVLVQEQRLVSLTGYGGTGKSLLALQVASEMLEFFPQGVYWLDLEYIRTADELREAIVSVLGLPQLFPEEAQDQITRYLLGSELLIVLDNHPQGLPSQEILSQLLAGVDGLNLLVTCRSPLNMPEESDYDLQGLDFPPAGSAQNLEKFGAFNLFVQTAQHIGSDFRVSHRNMPWISQICRLVGGQPLGIELAASWVQTFDCEEIANKMAARQAIVSSAGPEELNPHQLIEVVIDSFWDLLSPTDQLTLCRLSVFKGGFRREMAQHITGASPFFLDALVAKSLLNKSAQGIYHLPQLLRFILRQRLSEKPGETKNTQTKLAQAYAEAVSSLDVSDSLEGLSHLKDEEYNLLAAWEWCLEYQLTSAMLILLEKLPPYFLYSGAAHQAYRIFLDAYQHLAAPDWQVPEARETVLKLKGRLLALVGYFAYTLGNQEDGRRQLEEAITSLGSAGDPSGAARALIYLAEIEQDLGNIASQEKHLKEALKYYQTAQQPEVVCELNNLLGAASAARGEPGMAIRYYETARKISQDVEDPRSIAGSLCGLGRLAYQRGEYKQAAELLEQSLQLSQSAGARSLNAEILQVLGEVVLAQKKYQKSANFLREALQNARQVFAGRLMIAILVQMATLCSTSERDICALALLEGVNLSGEQPAERLRQQLMTRLAAGEIQQARQFASRRTFYGLIDELLALDPSLQAFDQLILNETSANSDRN